jgi:segregation and condensation protein A
MTDPQTKSEQPAPEDTESTPGPEPTAASAPHHHYEKTAADLRKEEESAFPFSVIVGQVYEGPYDLLLDLVRRQNIDIYDIPIAKITAQFLAYVEHLKVSDVDTAGEFIYMSALLIHIKSKMLLPRSPAESPEEAADPRLELVERLLEHERFRNAAQRLQQKRQLEEATWTNPGMREFRETADADQDIAADTLDLVRVFREVLDRAKSRPVLDVSEDSVTVRQMIDFVRRRLMMEDRPVGLSKLLANTRSVNAVVAMFLALLELVLRQDRGFSEIFIKKHEQFEQVINERLSARDDWS